MSGSHVPLVVAHRGDSWSLAEHTLSAYVAAIDSGADALECDVRLTRDAQLVCVHDRTVNRTSSGRGTVSEFTLAELDAFDFSSWYTLPNGLPTGHDGELPERQDGGVLRLETLLELVRDCARPVRILIETKHPTRWSGLVETELVRLLARFGWTGEPSAASGLRHLPQTGDLPVTVMSFAATALRRVRLLAPHVPLVLLFERMLPIRREGILPTGVRIAGPDLELLRADPKLAERIRRRGNEIYVWTVDEPADVEFVLGLGVDAVITNRPSAVVGRLRPAR